MQMRLKLPRPLRPDSATSRVLALLKSRRKKLVPRLDLLSCMFEDSAGPEDECLALRIAIKKIRQRGHKVETIWNKGYKLL